MYQEILYSLFSDKQDRVFWAIFKLQPFNSDLVEIYLNRIITDSTPSNAACYKNIFKGLLDRLDLNQYEISLSLLALAIENDKPQLLQALIDQLIKHSQSNIMNTTLKDLSIQLIQLSCKKNNLTCLNIILQQQIETRDWTYGLLKTNLVTYLANDSDTNHLELIERLKTHETRLPARPKAACKSSQVSTTRLSKAVAPCIQQLNDKLKTEDFQEDEFIAYLKQNIKKIKKIPHNEKIKISELIIGQYSLDSYKLLCEQCDFCIQTADDTTQLFKAMFKIPKDIGGYEAQEFLKYFMSKEYPNNVKRIAKTNHLPIVAYLVLCNHDSTRNETWFFPDELLADLISNGFDINQALPNTQETPLHLAVSLLDDDAQDIVVDLLMKQKNLNTKAKNHKNKTPLDRAVHLKKWELVQQIKQYEKSHSI